MKTNFLDQIQTLTTNARTVIEDTLRANGNKLILVPGFTGKHDRELLETAPKLYFDTQYDDNEPLTPYKIIHDFNEYEVFFRDEDGDEYEQGILLAHIDGENLCVLADFVTTLP